MCPKTADVLEAVRGRGLGRPRAGRSPGPGRPHRLAAAGRTAAAPSSPAASPSPSPTSPGRCPTRTSCRRCWRRSTPTASPTARSSSSSARACTGPARPRNALTLLGRELLSRLEVIDHQADRPETLVKVSDDPPGQRLPPVRPGGLPHRHRVHRAALHGRLLRRAKGRLPGPGGPGHGAAVPRLRRRWPTPRPTTASWTATPATRSRWRWPARSGVDFLFNVAITRDRRIAGIYCGDLEAAHAGRLRRRGRAYHGLVPDRRAVRPGGHQRRRLSRWTRPSTRRSRACAPPCRPWATAPRC